MSDHPNLKWAERKDKLFVTIELIEVKDAKIDIVNESRLTFSGTSEGKQYSLDIELFGEVNKEESKWTLDARNIFLSIKKKTKGPHWNFINKDKKKYNNIKVDWALYVDEDEEEEKMGGDFGGFPGMGGFGGNNFMDMGGMGGMGGADDLDEDDVKPEDKNQGEEGLDDLDKPQESTN
jgi:prostaglandin-E synthase